MSKQPEALMCATWLESHDAEFYPQQHRCAAELRRLHALNGELLEALKALTHSLERGELLHDDQRAAFDSSIAAITKAEAA